MPNRRFTLDLFRTDDRPHVLYRSVKYGSATIRELFESLKKAFPNIFLKKKDILALQLHELPLLHALLPSIRTQIRILFAEKDAFALKLS